MNTILINMPLIIDGIFIIFAGILIISDTFYNDEEPKKHHKKVHCPRCKKSFTTSPYLAVIRQRRQV